MDIVETVKTLLQINSNEWDGVINAHILLVTQKILNYCQIEKLPEALNAVVVSKVVAHMRLNVDDFKSVKSTSFGDTSVTYNTSAIPANVIDDVTSQLIPFRRVVFK